MHGMGAAMHQAMHLALQIQLRSQGMHICNLERCAAPIVDQLVHTRYTQGAIQLETDTSTVKLIDDLEPLEEVCNATISKVHTYF